MCFQPSVRMKSSFKALLGVRFIRYFCSPLTKHTLFLILLGLRLGSYQSEPPVEHYITVPEATGFRFPSVSVARLCRSLPQNQSVWCVLLAWRMFPDWSGCMWSIPTVGWTHTCGTSPDSHMQSTRTRDKQPNWTRKTSPGLVRRQKKGYKMLFSNSEE